VDGRSLLLERLVFVDRRLPRLELLALLDDRLGLIELAAQFVRPRISGLLRLTPQGPVHNSGGRESTGDPG
jgi:hypothetical protein